MEPISGIKAGDGGEVSAPGDLLDDGDDPGGDWIAVDQLADIRLDGGDLLASGVTKRAKVLLGDFAAGGFDLVGERGALLDQLAAQADEGAEIVARTVGWLPARQFGVALLAVAGEPSGIDTLALAEAAQRADEGLDLAGVG